MWVVTKVETREGSGGVGLLGPRQRSGSIRATTPTKVGGECKVMMTGGCWCIVKGKGREIHRIVELGAETKFRWRASQAKGSSVRSRTRRRQIKSLGLAASSYLASSDGKQAMMLVEAMQLGVVADQRLEVVAVNSWRQRRQEDHANKVGWRR